MDLVSQVTELRVDADTLCKHAKSMKTSPEMTLAWRSLQMGRSWLGKFKGELRQVKTVDKIPPTVDVSNVSERDGVHIEKLDFVNKMRNEIKSMVLAIDKLPQTPFVINASKHFSEARFWYGFELANMRQD